MGETWIFTSGKGGVGKSILCSCLGIGLTRLGKSVCIVDTDIGLRDQDVILGQENRTVYDLVDVCNRSCRLNQALLHLDQYANLTLLPASQFARCKELKISMYIKVINELKNQFDYVLIDSPAGVEKGLRVALSAPLDQVIILCTPDDVCIRNADRVVQLVQEKELPRPSLIVNRLSSDLIRMHEMYSAEVVAQTLDLSLLGEVPEDSAVYRALISHRSAMDVDCDAQCAVMRIARRISGDSIPLPRYGCDTLPWYKRLMHKNPPKLMPKEVTRFDR